MVEHASGLLVLNPKNPGGEPLAAELIAISDKVDLALIRCDSLDAPAVPLVESLPPRGSDIMVLGYPLGPEFGKSLKSTRGSMVAMPDASVDNMCLYDAVTNPGNSGGPLCDKKAPRRGCCAGGHRKRWRQLRGGDSHCERDAVSAVAHSGSGCGFK